MLAFLAEHILEILFGLISAGALAFCKYMHKQLKNYKQLLAEKKDEQTEEMIENRLEPILHEIEELRKYIREVGAVEKTHMDLIISSYRFRLVQLCKEFLRQGYMTEAQYEQLSEFYKLYHGLGGNGQAEDFYNRVMRLPIHEIEEK